MVSFSGAGSGIDFASITTQLVKLEKLPIAGLETKKSGADHQIKLVSDFATKLRGLETAAKELDTASKVRAVKATTSNEDRVKVTATGSAQLGTFDIGVTALARAQTNQSRTFATNDAGVASSGSIDITIPTGGDDEGIEGGGPKVTTIEWDSDETLTSIARKINDANGGVRASVLHDGTNYRLLMSSDETGTEHAFTVNDPGDLLGFGDSGNELTAGRDAQFTVAGVPVTRSSNTLTDVIEGVTFELISETPANDPPTQVQISRDPDGLAKKVQTFIDAMNNVQSFVSGQLSNKEADPNDSLRNDSMLQGFQRRFSALLSSAHGPDQTSLGRFGIKLARDGTLSLDRTKLDASITAEPDGLARLMAGSGGMVTSMAALTGDYTRSGDGVLASKQTAIRSRIKGWDGQIERIESKATSLQERLTRQFSATDSTIAILNSQSTYINSMLF